MDIYNTNFHHDVLPFLQPYPVRTPGGDCFVCATLACLSWLYKDKEFTFDEIYDSFIIKINSEYCNEFFEIGNSWCSYPSVLENIQRNFNLVDFSWRINSCNPVFRSNDGGSWHRDKSLYTRYWKSLLQDLESGLIILSINLDGSGPWVNGKWSNTDHLVLLDGVRSRLVPLEHFPTASAIVLDVRMVCSVNGVKWISVQDLLDLHGAGSWYVLNRV
jgi:hypothetical protein